jgi:hypothetical protein
VIAPWKNNPGVKLPDLLDYPWELYDLRTDWTQYEDVSKKYPEKLKEMQALFVEEGKKYNVFPLNNEGFQRILQPRPSGSPGMTEFSYVAPISIALGAMPPYVARDFKITADIDIPEGGADGMLITEGGRFDGWGLYLLKGKPVFTYTTCSTSGASAGRAIRPSRPAGTRSCSTSTMTARVSPRAAPVC